MATRRRVPMLARIPRWMDEYGLGLIRLWYRKLPAATRQKLERLTGAAYEKELRALVRKHPLKKKASTALKKHVRKRPTKRKATKKKRGSGKKAAKRRSKRTVRAKTVRTIARAVKRRRKNDPDCWMGLDGEKKGKSWLKKQLGVAQDERIPTRKLEWARRQSGRLERSARFAMTMRNFKRASGPRHKLKKRC